MANFDRISNLSIVTEQVTNTKRSFIEYKKQRAQAINLIHQTSGLDKSYIMELIDSDANGYKLQSYQNRIMDSVLKYRNYEGERATNKGFPTQTPNSNRHRIASDSSATSTASIASQDSSTGSTPITSISRKRKSENCPPNDPINEEECIEILEGVDTNCSFTNEELVILTQNPHLNSKIKINEKSQDDAIDALENVNNQEKDNLE
jgi:hypothetical protein